MALYDEATLKIVKRLQNARLSLLQKQPFYALLLMHMKFSLDDTCETVYTDGVRIAFNSDFLNEIDDDELEFVLMHVVLHNALDHPFRVQADYDCEIYDKACDIVVNSNILHSFKMDEKKISLKKYGVALHKAPDGEEGYKYTVEEIYGMLRAIKAEKQSSNDGDGQDEGDGDGESEDNCNGEGEGNGDGEGKGDGEGNDGGNGTTEKGAGAGKGNNNGKARITKKALKNLIASVKQNIAEAKIQYKEIKEANDDTSKSFSLDDHSFWNGDDEVRTQKTSWETRLLAAADAVVSSQGGADRGEIPMCAERLLEELKNPVIDWRAILNDFVQEEIVDYSFAPPDKRMEDCPFFLPDFNEKDESVKDILFMVDTSGSMSDGAISQCYSEIYNSILQFNGKLQGKLGFFDATVVEPKPFETEEEFEIIRPKGGGGTSFDCIFEYIDEYMRDEQPISIIILTDGYAPFPDESAAKGIPVLWIINNDKVTPPWGKIARLIVDEPKRGH